MSILSGKHILIVGDENQQVLELEKALRQHEMQIYNATCGQIALSEITTDAIDIIILNHIHEGVACVDFLHELQNRNVTRTIPIFALVGVTEDSIQHALMLGAADYITVNESIASVLQKMKVILGEPDNFSGVSSIDLSTTVSPATVSAIKIYTVEDDSLLRNLLTLRFEKSSYTHEFSKDGVDVIKHLRAFEPDIIILDIMLPNVNGLDILEQIKQTSDLKQIPIIMFSNRDEPADKKRAFDLGADRFYVKAMTDLSVLVETIEELAA
jgi:DNA-binding response OmpR family regulator